MQKIICASMLAAAAFVFGSEARAAGGQWGLHTGDTLASGDNMVSAEAGWPDFSLGFQHGLSNILDIGGRLSLSYGLEGTTLTLVGMGLRVPIRINVLRSEKLSMLIHVDPGVKFAAFSGPLFGIQFPIGLELGIHVTREATVQVGFDMPFYLNLTNGVAFNIPPQGGAGFEYHINDNIAVGVNTRFGAAILVGRGFAASGFAFLTQANFAYRL